MRLPFLEFVQRRFHYELDKAQEEYNRSLGRMEDGEFERGFIAGLERGLYLIKDSKESWGSNPLDDIPKADDSTDDSNDDNDSDNDSNDPDNTEEESGSESIEGSDSEPSGGSTEGSSSDGEGPEFDYPLDATT